MDKSLNDYLEMLDLNSIIFNVFIFFTKIRLYFLCRLDIIIVT